MRNLSEAAGSDFLATVQGQRAFRLSLIRALARTYLESAEAAERIRAAEPTVESRREGLQITRVRFDAGITSELDYRHVESLLTQAETQLASLRLTSARAENALGVLEGGSVVDSLPNALPLAQRASFMLAAGRPSELLVARPDILAAEEQLRAARADIGAACGVLSVDCAHWECRVRLGGAEHARRQRFAHLKCRPSVNVPIFNLGRTRGNLRVANAAQNIAVARYERVIQTAFEKVADALAGRRYLADQVAAQERGTFAQRRIAELARIRYNEGVVGCIEVLDAERNLFIAEQALLQLRRAEVENL